VGPPPPVVFDPGPPNPPPGQDFVPPKDKDAGGPKDLAQRDFNPPKDLAQKDFNPPKDLGQKEFNPPKDLFNKDFFKKDVFKKDVFNKDVFNKDFPNGAFGEVPPGKGPVILSQQGRLLPTDPQRDGKPHKSFGLRMVQNKTYVIDMVATAEDRFDPFLRLYDPLGKMVAWDDDGGGYPNARIRYTAGQTGNYEIAATCFGFPRQGGGAFMLTVREEP
jgi:hypothetical protein